MSRVSLASLKAEASEHGYVVTKRDGEYRVAPYRPADRAWAEARAYYTDSATDARDTLRAMIQHGGI
jgi:hypothetical protein